MRKNENPYNVPTTFMLAFFLFFTLNHNTKAQTNTLVELTDTDFNALSVAIDTANEYLVTAGYWGLSSDGRAYVSQSNLCHEVVRAKVYGMDDVEDKFYRIRPFNNGLVSNGYVAVGWSDRTGMTKATITVLDDTLGTVTAWDWARNDDNMAYDVIQTSDDGFAVAGECVSNTGDKDAFVIKFSSKYTWEWTTILGDDFGDEVAWALLENNAGNLLVTGETQIPGSGGIRDILIAQLEMSNGVPIPTASGADYLAFGSGGDEIA
ncbi:MAG: hypothetical protein AAF570_25440, partial [Bacteroidota bacterium]